MSKNKTIYRGRGGQIFTPILRGHRAGGFVRKKAEIKSLSLTMEEILK